jgi:hypothetical protein
MSATIYGKAQMGNHPLSTMKLFSASKTNFAASTFLTARGRRHLSKGNIRSNPSAGRSVVSNAPAPGEKKRELQMKVTKLFTLLAGSSLLLSASVFAGNGNKKTLRFDTSVTVEGKSLAPGEYKFEWSGTGPDVKLNILKGKETVASVAARVVSVPIPNKQDGYSATAAKDGSHSLTTLFFSGDKYDLQIGDATSANTTPTTDPKGSN